MRIVFAAGKSVEEQQRVACYVHFPTYTRSVYNADINIVMVQEKKRQKKSDQTTGSNSMFAH
jgi:hypothetical protein